MKNLYYFSLVIIICISCKIDRNSLEPTPVKEEKQIIAFVSDRDGNSEIYTMDIDGENETRLTNNPGRDFRPKFSPDGSKIAYYSYRDGTSTLVIMNTDGSGKKVLLNDIYGIPIFSPDGQRIVMNNSDNLVLINTDGTNFFELVSHSLYFFIPSVAKFSSDGSTLLFSCDWYNSGNIEICTINTDGTNLTNLTLNSEFDAHPSFSSDGSAIVYRTGAYPDTEYIYIMDADGRNKCQIFKDTLFSDPRYPIFSPDGSKIIFTAEGLWINTNKVNNSKGNPFIFIMDQDGNNCFQLSHNNAWSDEALFLPNGFEIMIPEDGQIVCYNFEGSNRRIISDLGTDKLHQSGQYIYFISRLDNVRKIFRMNVDGSELIILSDQQLSGYYLSVQPLIQ